MPITEKLTGHADQLEVAVLKQSRNRWLSIAKRYSTPHQDLAV
jgi:hypothetical protein